MNHDVLRPRQQRQDAPQSGEARAETSACPRSPADWPAPGPIDQGVHDGPHASSDIEWWYVNTNLEGADGRPLGVFAAFFRQVQGRDRETGDRTWAHFITWGVSDPAAARYHGFAAVDRHGPQAALDRLDARAELDPRMRRALREVLARGAFPAPTRLFTTEVRVASTGLALDYDGNTLVRTGDGCYRLALRDEATGASAELSLTAQKPAVRHGDDGVAHGPAAERMFYYFLPRCAVHGAVGVGGKEVAVQGLGWFDHEFGYVPKTACAGGGDTAWNWLSLQFDNGFDLTVYSVTRGDVRLDHWLVISDDRGEVRRTDDVTLTPTASWRSLRTFVSYPVAWDVRSAAFGVDLRVEATFSDQEVITIVSDPGFWEGQVSATGRLSGGRVCGRGWVERKGFRYTRLGDFFDAVGQEVRRAVATALPDRPTGRDIGAMATGGGHDVIPPGFDVEAWVSQIARPVREQVDRGGKAWRSYAGLATIELVGGDPHRFVHWLAFPEILHVASLIVDDVEDRSTVRRGGPACHVLHGEATAINAASAAYFIAEPPVHKDAISECDRLRIYRLYFEAMRAGHAGQALDLAGHDEAVRRAVETGDAAALEGRVRCIHHLKTAVPAASLARIGVILGGGAEEQINAVGLYLEKVGLAFQIVDDVLNLRGFHGDLKTRGEDVMHGKFTLPVVKALARLDVGGRRRLAAAVAGRPQTEAEVAVVLAVIDGTGANDACLDEARALVEEGWRGFDALIPDSQCKVMFRAFGWYLLERHS